MSSTAPVTVVLDAWVVHAIRLHSRRAPGVETGGVLYQIDEERDASGPGPAASCAPNRLEWDASYIAGVVDTVCSAGGRILGRWHKHTGPVILASDEDRRSAEVFRQAVGAEELVDVIVACDSDDRLIGWSAYLCSTAGYERVQVELPTGVET